jgi:hypothetical protein
MAIVLWTIQEMLLNVILDLFNPAYSWPSDAQEATIRIFPGIVPNEGQNDAELLLQLNKEKMDWKEMICIHLVDSPIIY